MRVCAFEHMCTGGAAAAPTPQMLVVHEDGQEGMMDLEAAVVFDETQLLEFVHEKFTRERVVPIISASVS
jgi:hypothetical protein